MWTDPSRIPTIQMIIESHHHRRTTAMAARSYLFEAMRTQNISESKRLRC